MAMISDKWRRRLLLPMLLASIGVPFAIFHEGFQNAVKGAWNWTKSAGSNAMQNSGPPPSTQELLSNKRLDTTLDPAPLDPAKRAAPNEPQLPAPKLSGPPVRDFREVMHFEITPSWVMQNWKRVSTTLGDLELEGMRVPLVTGTRKNDLAGSMTYYFDKNHNLQRLEFEGYTGDPRRLVMVATGYFKLEPNPTLGAGYFTAKWNGKPTSILWVGLAPVVKSDAPRSQYKVLMEINRPAKGFRLSRKNAAFIANKKNAGRW